MNGIAIAVGYGPAGNGESTGNYIEYIGIPARADRVIGPDPLGIGRAANQSGIGIDCGVARERGAQNIGDAFNRAL